MEGNYDLTNPYEIARYIKEAKKATPVKVYIKGDISDCDFGNIEDYGSADFHVSFWWKWWDNRFLRKEQE